MKKPCGYSGGSPSCLPPSLTLSKYFCKTDEIRPCDRELQSAVLWAPALAQGHASGRPSCRGPRRAARPRRAALGPSECRGALRRVRGAQKHPTGRGAGVRGAGRHLGAPTWRRCCAEFLHTEAVTGPRNTRAWAGKRQRGREKSHGTEATPLGPSSSGERRSPESCRVGKQEGRTGDDVHFGLNWQAWAVRPHEGTTTWVSGSLLWDGARGHSGWRPTLARASPEALCWLSHPLSFSRPPLGSENGGTALQFMSKRVHGTVATVITILKRNDDFLSCCYYYYSQWQ